MNIWSLAWLSGECLFCGAADDNGLFAALQRVIFCDVMRGSKYSSIKINGESLNELEHSLVLRDSVSY